MRVLKFEAIWCTPCKRLTKVMEGMEIPFPVEHIDIDQRSDVAIEFGIRSVPTLIMMDENNNIIKRIGGAISKQQLEEWMTV